MIRMKQDFFQPENEVADEDKLTPYRNSLQKSFRVANIVCNICNDAFHVKRSGTTLEFIAPDFFLPEHHTYVLLSKGNDTPARDKQRVAMLKGMYPKFDFVILNKSDINALDQKMATPDMFINAFKPGIE